MLMKWGQSDERGESFWLSASGIDTEINLSAQCWASLSTLQNSSEMEEWRGQVLNIESLPLWFSTGRVLLTSGGLWAAHHNPHLQIPLRDRVFLHHNFAEVHSLTCCVAVVPAGGSLPVCAACKQRIYDEQYLQALNSDWHAICFRYVAPMKHSGHKLCLFIKE